MRAAILPHMRNLLPLFLLLPSLSWAADSNLELRAMTQADQAGRKAGNINWDVLGAEDTQRRVRVRAMLAAGSVKTAEDFYNAALIMQHGSEVQDYKLAFSLANISAEIDPESKSFTPAYKSGKWLMAAAWDRHMMNLGKPQWYGTQITKPHGKALWEVYQLDESAVSDAERQAHGVMPREEMQKKVAEMNKSAK
ncbi:hypothetical protein [Pseudoduganella sp. OTU4001]|uniref:hypothetical protein n=1 Tax=Pseudoduganella sp. OTU4001 TaxID=3043854 RepID=UPI00313F0677